LWLTPDGRPLSPTAVSKAFDVLVRAFLASSQGQASGAQRLTFHGMRHSFVVTHVERGTRMEHISKLLGHASSAFTIDRYGHLLPEVADGLSALYVVPEAPADPESVEEVA
jgi:integrase